MQPFALQSPSPHLQGVAEEVLSGQSQARAGQALCREASWHLHSVGKATVRAPDLPLPPTAGRGAASTSSLQSMRRRPTEG